MLTRIDIENFRCIETACLEFDARATGIIGANASGKTSLLEAIYFLGHGRSFRSQSRDKLLRSGAEHFRIVARLRPESRPDDAPVAQADEADFDDGGCGDRTTESACGRTPGSGAIRTGSGAIPGETGAASPDPGGVDGGRYPVEGVIDFDGKGTTKREGGYARDRPATGPVQPAWDLGENSSPGVLGRREIVAGIEYVQGVTRAHLAGRGVGGISEIAGALPIQVIDPGIHRLIEEGSVRRRRLMDWGVFHVKHEFLVLWRRYQRALLQRNTALRTAASPEVVGAWDQELETAGSVVDALRADYVERLAPYFEQIGARLIGGDVRFAYRRGWPADQDLGAALRASHPRDLRLKATQVGPHRADLAFLVEGEPARDRVSRGQQKMLAAAFILSQLALRVAERAPRACLMLDDPAAELDVDNLGKLLAVIADIPAQLIVTSVHQRGLRGLGIARMFHVERGRFRTMI